MKQYQKIALAVAAFAVASVGFAQENAPSGLLGQRYAEASFSVVDVPGTSTNGYDAGLAVNLPVTPTFDATFGYDYDWIKVGNVKGHDHTLAAGAKLYSVYSGVKPFLGLGLGYQWSKITASGVSRKDDQALWAAGVGVEVPYQGFVFTPAVRYGDGFETGASGSYQYSLEASRWFTAKVNGYPALAFDNTVGRGGQVWVYQIGARLKF